ncbi:cupredoxin domain-containing protein [Candidatus Nitronereus thalassa]|uniref:Cupredoxin domain-containing protein n=1 Tax=Candidatus Nitronereus thalassa TaxID=3020898 RepID=A0ABU3K7I3_9BACT|nr:cupredoxin domain-containing protein [Candidatus Nitronereus thalassa]MDT7042400.1 cupredoxin domain-containing protein [Candidatus Nitronereus thalassa]
MRRISRTPLSKGILTLVLGWGLVGGLGVLISPLEAAPHSNSHSAVENVRVVTVHIENRRFLPHVIHLRVGEQTRLVLKNDDVELHAFVPADLLAQTHVQVSGNGAPQFNGQGFQRVLIPSQGHAELTFSAKHAGSYPFFCDLPGHVMNGTIVVED